MAQQGFEEGNAIQYTWAVPQNLAGLFGLMGGDRASGGQAGHLLHPAERNPVRTL